MTEYNIFCCAENFNDENSFQQKRYRAFNKEVGEKRYYEIVSAVNEIFKGFKLDLKTDSWQEAWGKVTPEMWLKLSEISEFDKSVVEQIIGFELDIKPLTKPETINIGGVVYEVTEELKVALSNLKETQS